MQAASHGLRGFARMPGIGIGPPGTTGNAHRSIHISSILYHPPTLPKVPNVGTAQRLLSQTRNILTRFVGHLTASDLGTVPSSIGRGVHTGATTRVGGYNARASIQQAFSLPTKVALGRPLQAPYLPRAPVTPRSVMQVGLGTARNFSTGRPIFHHLVENVPIAGRAFYEADWDIRLKEERQIMLAKHSKEKKARKTKEMQKPTVSSIIIRDATTNDVSSSISAEIDEYFPLPTVPEVTTYLLIPLAPTPTSRLPLSSTELDGQPRLPLRAIGHMHASYSLHSIKVSSLFSRLDAANVWAPNVKCSAYAHGSAVCAPPDGSSGEAEGVCTVLKLEFIGWTKAKVRSVIGDSGTGWCVLEEVSTTTKEDDTDSLTFGGTDDTPSTHDEYDPSQSLIMPTLDFSSTFVQSLQSPIDRGSPVAHTPDLPTLEFDMDSSSGSDSISSSVSMSSSLGSDTSAVVFVDPPSTNGYFGFSSEFLRRRSDTLRDEDDWAILF